MAKKKTILDLQKMKETGEQAVWMVIYDACLASCAEEAGMDMILVGDSLAQGALGYADTLPVTMEDMLMHVAAVRRGAPEAFVVADMPFMRPAL